MSRRSTSAALLLCVLACGYAQVALAERADRNKPIHITADRVMLDDAKQMGVFSGDVLMTQGTLSVSGDQIVVTQGKRGLEQGVATGNPAKFRQKQEGVNEYVEGSGDRIEYNAVTGIMDIYGHAHVRRGQDDVRGDHITYNARDQSFMVSGAPKRSKPVTVTIGPRTPASAPAAEPLPIRPETRLIKPDDNK
jgi:lipopolysaccharide export system protein LptA